MGVVGLSHTSRETLGEEPHGDGPSPEAFASQLCPLTAVWPWGGHLTSLSLSSSSSSYSVGGAGVRSQCIYTGKLFGSGWRAALTEVHVKHCSLRWHVSPR